MSILMTTLDESKIIPDTRIVSRKFSKGPRTMEVRYFQNRNREHCIAATFIGPRGQQQDVNAYAEIEAARGFWRDLVKAARSEGYTPTETRRN
jgi:hypothetical protein